MIRRTIFIVTYGRSGSTMLQSMINKFPAHVIRGENNNALLGFVRSWYELSEFSPVQVSRMRPQGLPSTPSQPWFGFEEISPDELGEELAQLFMRQILRLPDSALAGGFKEIRWHEQPELFVPTLEFLRRFMPDARFVFNTRSHLAVSRSGWWRNMEKDSVVKTLETAEALYRKWQDAHPECSISMHYDDYTQSIDYWRPL